MGTPYFPLIYKTPEPSEIDIISKNIGKSFDREILSVSIYTIIISSIVFLILFSWFEVLRLFIVSLSNKDQDMKTTLFYAITMTFISLTIIFMIFYFNKNKK